MQESVQVVAHCVGSTSICMSLLSGAIQCKVRSLVCSQVAFRILLATAIKRIIGGLHISEIGAALGIPGIDAYSDADASWSDSLFNKFVKASVDLSTPYDELCSSPVCHRWVYISTSWIQVLLIPVFVVVKTCVELFKTCSTQVLTTTTTLFTLCPDKFTKK